MRSEDDRDTIGVLVSLPPPMLNNPVIPVPWLSDGCKDDRLMGGLNPDEAIDFCTAAPAACVDIVAEAVDRSVVGTEEPSAMEREAGEGLKKLDEKVPVDEDRGK